MLLRPAFRTLAVRPSTSSLLTKPATQQTRSFLPTPTAPPQKFTARKTLPFPRPVLYSIIRDIDAYSSFLPFCSASIVTSRSTTPPTHPISSTPTSEQTKGDPTQADLKIGFGGFDETFSSKVSCSYDDKVGVVRADSGEAVSGREGEVFERLVTRWEVKDLEGSQGKDSEVKLDIEFTFKNPFYAMVTKSVTPKVAGAMMEAFEKRAGELVGRRGSGF
ncbi:hypothetical protein BJ508DRAFT_413524 [Ascobolus immersus RN42]|uniref:Coenzyme Q-binding protein COQ10 START domain-containing protein n=1 Tax=Ascobolus immersus RN42 TaxID=1160509 RepID=A0A3N4IB60_ASCIM|nr:hypothetical protein BJ508DRAFT_413524 [Ascobolus immersus RN42]